MAISKAYGYLKTEKTYKDFHMSLRFKCEGDGNSGVFFHVDFKPGTPDPLNQRAGARAGAMSVLCGVAAVESMKQARPVAIAELGGLPDASG